MTAFLTIFFVFEKILIKKKKKMLKDKRSLLLSIKMRLEDDKSTQIGVEEFFATKIS
jgi:hypothetical protein